MNQEQRIEYFMSEIARLSNQVVDLQDERDALAARLSEIEKSDSQEVLSLKADNQALAAMVEALREALLPFASTGLPTLVNGENYSVMHDRVKDWFGVSEFVRAIECFNKTTQQHLAEVRAQAAIKGWWACWEWFDSDDRDKLTLIPAADQYADSIRQESK